MIASGPAVPAHRTGPEASKLSAGQPSKTKNGRLTDDRPL